MKQDNESLQHLAEIRNLMERSSRFISLSGLSGVAAGITALAGWTLACFGLGLDPRFFTSSPPVIPVKTATIAWPIFLDALVVIVVAVTAAILFTIRNSARKGLKAWDAAAKRLLLTLAFPLVTGGLFCIILIRYDLLFLLVPSSLLFYGLALSGAAHYTLHEIRILGIIQVILGLLAGLFPAFSLLLWAIGFGLMHIVYGIRMVRKYESGARQL